MEAIAGVSKADKGLKGQWRQQGCGFSGSAQVEQAWFRPGVVVLRGVEQAAINGPAMA